ncbi:MAG: SAM-dependent DNA methyltransferase, partial [Acidimicrobiia bacterium]|nr:SAM-dependent DNA methyltransferase [Acidimicrobiia bacterium]
MSNEAQQNNATLIWNVAEILRGNYKQSQYQQVVLPFTVLRRLDAVLTPKKVEFLAAIGKFEGMDGAEVGLQSTARKIYGHEFYNRSPLDFSKLLDDHDNVAANLKKYIAGFSPDVQEVFERFGFNATINDLDKKKILYDVVGRFATADLHPDTISNIEMGYLYEELIRKFSELSNETAGEHFTPREVIELMVNVLITDDDEILTKAGKIAKIYDPAAGTGGMLSVAENHIRKLNPGATVALYGQELNDETYAVAKSDLMVKGQDASRFVAGNSFTEDGHADETFDYILANPPFGVDWKNYAKPIEEEHKQLGFDGRFGPGLPRKSDGSMLFLLHMIAKMKPVEDGGSRIAIIFNASPLFTGSPGGGESEIRRWIIENDWLEAIIAMPEQMFYNTGIATYIWIVTNVKSDERKGTVQLIDAREMWEPMRKSLGDKRRYFSQENIDTITALHAAYTDADESVSKVFPN